MTDTAAIHAEAIAVGHLESAGTTAEGARLRQLTEEGYAYALTLAVYLGPDELRSLAQCCDEIEIGAA